MAEDLGKKLKVEIEECGLDEVGGKCTLIKQSIIDIEQIFQALRLRHGNDATPALFGLPQIDRIANAIASTNTRSQTSTQPNLELASLHPGAGSTALLYHLAVQATLPTAYGGKEACIVFIDTDGTFSITRLVAQYRSHLNSYSDPPEDADDVIGEALKHIHIFCPQLMSSFIATIKSLPDYLFNKSRHFSSDRAVAFIAIDSVTAFYWQVRAEEDLAAINGTSSTAEPKKPSPWSELTKALRSTSATLQCAVVLTSNHLFPIPASTQGTNPAARIQSLRPTLPPPLGNLPTLRLLISRRPVRKFPAHISIDEAQREDTDRLKAVQERRCEAVVGTWGMDDRTLRELEGMEGGVGMGFGFRVTGSGLRVEGEKGQDQGPRLSY